MVSGVAEIIIVSILSFETSSCQFSVASSRSNEFLCSIRRFLFVYAIYSLSTKGLLLQALALIPPHQPVPITPTFICFIN